jgi:HPt (histidine-containing phosphotransfer) domain-containing protein
MDGTIIDLKNVLERVQNDIELLIDLFDIFDEDFMKKREQMEHYLTAGDCDMLRDIAHSLKGAASNIAADRVSAICLFLEKEAAEGRLECFPAKLKKLDEEFIQYRQEALKIRERYQSF